MNITVAQPFNLTQEQKDRLQALGNVTFYDTMSKSPEEWLRRVEHADIICTGKYGLRTHMDRLADKFISLRSVGVGWADQQVLARNNLTLANCPGCNRYAVAEWIMGMMIMLLRNFPSYINSTDTNLKTATTTTPGLYGRSVCILGRGQIGSLVGEHCTNFGMRVNYITRQDKTMEKASAADIVIDCLSVNDSTRGLLDEAFFFSLKQGTHFITVTDEAIYDTLAMVKALNKGILAGVAIDGGSVIKGDVASPYYRKISSHPKILATPHLSFDTESTDSIGNDMMIANVEAYVKGERVNVVNKEQEKETAPINPTTVCSSIL